MGNCQAAEAATVVIQHPANNKIERIYWSVSAHEIMNSNPGYYVALLLTSSTLKSQSGAPIKQLKLLRPDDTLLIGHVYRLISFEDVLKEFAAKKCVKLGKLLKMGGALAVGMKMKDSDSDSDSSPNPTPNPTPNSKSSENYIKPEQEAGRRPEISDAGSSGGGKGGGQRGMGRHYGGGGQWRPALQSIAEVGIN